ncbi:type II toxin-antitoxin system death-on-curing family toxin [Thiocapsa bogorovii]|uniref:type II toxin-antitoxin system death-on-curing family toxin n=1 Tax=Thiocapsa bogorovii TaxID=521689 RepID=UPI001E617AA2|nr:Fic family protein [Thiocapsa bogorovii]UHD16009.1 Fic family protein [Thiocapsa bogorovii]
MSTSVIYLTLEQAVEVHRKTVEVSGGGAMGHLDLGKLDSVLTHIQNDDYYPTFADKLTHLFFGACKFHSFQDGNKRVAITLCAQMLLFNGYLYCSDRFIREMENISYHVAAGRIDKDLLGEIIAAVLDDELEAESLKLKILNAISVDPDDGRSN